MRKLNNCSIRIVTFDPTPRHGLQAQCPCNSRQNVASTTFQTEAKIILYPTPSDVTAVSVYSTKKATQRWLFQEKRREPIAWLSPRSGSYRATIRSDAARRDPPPCSSGHLQRNSSSSTRPSRTYQCAWKSRTSTRDYRFAICCCLHC